MKLGKRITTGIKKKKYNTLEGKIRHTNLLATPRCAKGPPEGSKGRGKRGLGVGREARGRAGSRVPPFP